MSWKSDIEEWIESWFELGQAATNQFHITQNVAIRGGWDPKKYVSSMKQNLHQWLTDWYTLSVKTLRKPATQHRRNPIFKEYVNPFLNYVQPFDEDEYFDNL